MLITNNYVFIFFFFFQPVDVYRTVAINCGYIGTSDYTIEPGDREFMIRVCIYKYIYFYHYNSYNVGRTKFSIWVYTITNFLSLGEQRNFVSDLHYYYSSK